MDKKRKKKLKKYSRLYCGNGLEKEDVSALSRFEDLMEVVISVFAKHVLDDVNDEKDNSLLRNVKGIRAVAE